MLWEFLLPFSPDSSGHLLTAWLRSSLTSWESGRRCLLAPKVYTCNMSAVAFLEGWAGWAVGGEGDGPDPALRPGCNLLSAAYDGHPWANLPPPPALGFSSVKCRFGTSPALWLLGRAKLGDTWCLALAWRLVSAQPQALSTFILSLRPLEQHQHAVSIQNLSELTRQVVLAAPFPKGGSWGLSVLGI